MIKEEIKQDKVNREPTSLRLIPKSKRIVEGFMLGINYILQSKGSSKTINFSQSLETLLLAHNSKSNTVLLINDYVYTYKDVMDIYIDEKCIKDLELFFENEYKIKEYLDEDFKYCLRFAIESIQEDIEFNEDIEVSNSDLDNALSYEAEGNLAGVYREIETICDDTGGREYFDIKDNMKEHILDAFGITDGIIDYSISYRYKNDIVKYNIERLEKLVDIYLFKKETENTYLKGKHIYKNQLETFIESKCKDLNIKCC